MAFGVEMLILCSKHVTDVEKTRKGLENKFMCILTKPKTKDYKTYCPHTSD